MQLLLFVYTFASTACSVRPLLQRVTWNHSGVGVLKALLNDHGLSPRKILKDRFSHRIYANISVDFVMKWRKNAEHFSKQNCDIGSNVTALWKGSLSFV